MGSRKRGARNIAQKMSNSDVFTGYCLSSAGFEKCHHLAILFLYSIHRHLTRPLRQAPGESSCAILLPCSRSSSCYWPAPFRARAGVSGASSQRRLVERLAGPARRPRWQPGGGGPRTSGSRPLRRAASRTSVGLSRSRLVAAPRPAETRGGIRRLVAGSRQRQPARPAPVPPPTSAAGSVNIAAAKRCPSPRGATTPIVIRCSGSLPAMGRCASTCAAATDPGGNAFPLRPLEPRRTAGIPQPGQPAVRHGLRADPRPAAVQPVPLHSACAIAPISGTC